MELKYSVTNIPFIEFEINNNTSSNIFEYIKSNNI